MKNRGYLLPLVLGLSCLVFFCSLILARIVSSDRLLVVRTEARMEGEGEALEEVYKGFLELLEEPTESTSTDHLELTRRVTVHPLESTVKAAVSTGRAVLEDDYSTLRADLDFDAGELNVRLEAVGVLLIESRGTAEGGLLFGSSDWRNQTVTGDFLLSQGTGVGLWIRARREGGRISGYLLDYSLLEKPLQGGTFAITKVTPEGTQRLAEKQGAELGLGGLAWLLGVRHSMTAGANQESLWFEVDGRRVLTAEDPQPLRNGRVGYQAFPGGILLVSQTTVRNLPEIRSLCKIR